jgi:hypothetical protein
MDEFAEMGRARARGEADREPSVVLATRRGVRTDPVDPVGHLDRDGRELPVVRVPTPRLGDPSRRARVYAFVMKTPEEIMIERAARETVAN